MVMLVIRQTSVNLATNIARTFAALNWLKINEIPALPGTAPLGKVNRWSARSGFALGCGRMADFRELEKKVERFTERLKAFQHERDQRSRLALGMLASIEQKVRSQAAAFEKATARIAELEKERDAAITRASAIIDLYESSLTNNDAFFRGIESLAQKLVGPTASPPKSPVMASRPSPVVYAPAKTPPLRELGFGQVQPRDRTKDNGGSGPSF